MTPPPFIPSYLPETPSQTAGPYVHIGLIPNQAGFDIFAINFGGRNIHSDKGPHLWDGRGIRLHQLQESDVRRYVLQLPVERRGHVPDHR